MNAREWKELRLGLRNTQQVSIYDHAAVLKHAIAVYGADEGPKVAAAVRLNVYYNAPLGGNPQRERLCRKPKRTWSIEEKAAAWLLLGQPE